MVGPELEYIRAAVERGHISGNGDFSKRAESVLSQISGSPDVLLTTNCTHALELSARLIDLRPGDEVIVPAYTFVSTASAFALAGARPVFADVSPETLNLDVDAVESLITERTRAVCTVHYAGIANDIDRLARICDSRGILLIEDNAHGLGATFAGKKLGTFGSLSTLSFHETKNVTCGEGGALAINDESYVGRAEILREKGTDRARFLRGQVDKYTWVDVGSSWLPSEILAAFLYAQLEGFDGIRRRRMEIWNRYDESLAPWAVDKGYRTPFVPSNAEHPAHMYYLHLPDIEVRDAFIRHMKDAGIMAVFHYQALNTSVVGKEFGAVDGQCPVAERAAQTLVRLPLFASLSEDDIDRVLAAVTAFPG